MAARCNGFLARCGAVLAKGLAWHSGGIFKLPDGIKLMRAILGMTLLGLSWAIGMGMLVLALDDLLLGRLNYGSSGPEQSWPAPSPWSLPRAPLRGCSESLTQPRNPLGRCPRVAQAGSRSE
jgi:hypothetical protein